MLNVEAKLKDPEYRHGMDALLRPEVAFDPDSAWKLMQERIVDRLMTPEDIAERKAASSPLVQKELRGRLNNRETARIALETADMIQHITTPTKILFCFLCCQRLHA